MRGQGDPIPIVRMNEGIPPGRAQYENWRAGAEAAYEFIALDGPDTFEGEGYACPVDDVIAAYAWRSGGICLRNETHIEQSGPVFWLQRHLKGNERVYSGAETCLLQPGNIVLLDMRFPSVMRGDFVERHTLVIPAACLPELVEETSVSHREFRLDSPQGRLLDDAIDVLYATLPEATLDDAAALRDGIVDLLCALLAEKPNKRQSTQIRAAMFVSMKRYLFKRLEDPRVGTNDLRETFACSRATVYRIFEEVGGVHQYLRDQRLTKVFEALTTPSSRKKVIRQTAERWGFDNPSHFNHLFKQTFGLTPSEAVRRAPSSPPLVEESPHNVGDIDQFRQWMTDT